MKVARWLWMVIRLCGLLHLEAPELPLETELQILRLKEKPRSVVCVYNPS